MAGFLCASTISRESGPVSYIQVDMLGFLKVQVILVPDGYMLGIFNVKNASKGISRHALSRIHAGDHLVIGA